MPLPVVPAFLVTDVPLLAVAVLLQSTIGVNEAALRLDRHVEECEALAVTLRNLTGKALAK
jgi:hypothetical protein